VNLTGLGSRLSMTSVIVRAGDSPLEHRRATHGGAKPDARICFASPLFCEMPLRCTYFAAHDRSVRSGPMRERRFVNVASKFRWQEERFR
jgi:hypothetical protein